jgi:peroxiredoxin (alkyl hydroperoxide reductase subunit C)
MAISVDTVFSHNAFAESLGGLPYPLVADFEREVVTAWGVRREDVAGYKGMPLRSVFVLDPAGVVRWRWARSQEQPLPNVEQVITEAKAVAEGETRP